MSDLPNAQPDSLRPTAQDFNRDLLADLATCNAATRGPWAPKQGQPSRVVSLADEDGTVVASTYTSTFAPPIPEAVRNAHFICGARTGWESAIRLALHYKAEALRLREMIPPGD